MTSLIAVFSALIASFAALIGYFPWRTAHQRVVLDLFDRRLAIIREIEEAAKIVLNDPGRQKVDPAFWSFVRAESNARFLFGEDILKALAELRQDLANVMAFSDIPVDSPDYQRKVDIKYASLQRIVDFISHSSRLFAPYVRLDQKMPSLWWPG